MKSEKETNEFYVRLKSELERSNQWPTKYLYKFIVPSDNNKILLVENAFDNMGAVIQTAKSKTGKYTSISIELVMDSADAVIQKYKEVSVIEGIVSL